MKYLYCVAQNFKLEWTMGAFGKVLHMSFISKAVTVKARFLRWEIGYETVIVIKCCNEVRDIKN